MKKSILVAIILSVGAIGAVGAVVLTIPVILGPELQEAPFSNVYTGTPNDMEVQKVYYDPKSEKVFLQARIEQAVSGETLSFDRVQVQAQLGGLNNKTQVTLTRNFGWFVGPFNFCPDHTDGMNIRVTLYRTADQTIGDYTFTCKYPSHLVRVSISATPTYLEPLPPPPPAPPQETLTLDTATMVNSTSFALNFRNQGQVDVTLTGYYVKDAGGTATYQRLSGWNGPTIQVNQVATVYITLTGGSWIGSSFIFQSGYSYKIQVQTARGTLLPEVIVPK